MSYEKTVKKLQKEFRALEKGIKIKMPVSATIEYEVPLHISWQEDDYCSVDDNDFVNTEQFMSKVLNSVRAQIEKSINLQTKTIVADYNSRINKHIEQCNIAANKYGKDQNSFFEDEIACF